MKTGVLHSRKQVFLYLNYRCVLRLKLKDSLIVFSNIVIHCTCRERSPYNSFTYFSLVLDRATSEFKANIYTMSANLINLTLPFFLFFFFHYFSRLNGIVLIDNEQSRRIWIMSIFHCYQRCILVNVTSQIQRGIAPASKHCLAPIIVRYKNGIFRWSRLMK